MAFLRCCSAAPAVSLPVSQTAYNLVAIPVAAGLFVHWGFDLPMSVGAVAMSLSTIIVAANAQLLRGLKLQHYALGHAG
jgi:P-type Cu2+ transporter